MKPSEILDKAADIIARDGWTQGEFYVEPPVELDGYDYDELDEAANKSAPCCQAGAISRAVFGLAWISFREDAALGEHLKRDKRRAEEYMRRYLLGGDVADVHSFSAVSWNDDDARTAEEVEVALRGAAELARSDGQ